MATGRGNGRMSLSMKLIRLVIVLFNLVFVILGGLLLGLGIFVLKDPKMQQLRPLLDPSIATKATQTLSSIEVFAIVLIVIGGVLLFIGFLGCCGAVKSFRCLHIFYAIIIGLIILAEIVLVIIFVFYQNRFKNELVNKLQESIQKYYVGPIFNNSTLTNSISLSWDLTQFNLQCCGAVNQTDYQNATNWNRTNPYNPETNLTIPLTCCPMNAGKTWNRLPTNMSEASTCATTGVNSYSQGCYDRLIELMNQYKKYVIIGGIIVGVVEILAFLFAILLFCRRSDYENV